MKCRTPRLMVRQERFIRLVWSGTLAQVYKLILFTFVVASVANKRDRVCLWLLGAGNPMAWSWLATTCVHDIGSEIDVRRTQCFPETKFRSETALCECGSSITIACLLVWRKSACVSPCTNCRAIHWWEQIKMSGEGFWSSDLIKKDETNGTLINVQIDQSEHFGWQSHSVHSSKSILCLE